MEKRTPCSGELYESTGVQWDLKESTRSSSGRGLVGHRVPWRIQCKIVSHEISTSGQDEAKAVGLQMIGRLFIRIYESEAP